MSVTVHHMLNAKETKSLRKVSSVFVLRRVLKTEVKFVVVMVEHIRTGKSCKENHV